VTRRRPLSSPLAFHGLKVVCGWKCNALCAHCGVAAGPHAEGRLTREAVLAAIDDAAALGLWTLELTGGESFLVYRDLLAYVERACRHGLDTSVDSNGFWAKSVAVARQRLEPLRRRGLRRIVFSTDRYHQEYVPLARVLCALQAARELGLETSVTVCALAGDDRLLSTVAALRRQGTAVQVQRISPFGRAASMPRGSMLRSTFEQAGGPCQAVHTPTVAPDGRVTLCCAPPTRLEPALARVSPLVLGWLDREPLAAILRRARRDPLLRLLAARGPGALASRLRDLDGALLPPREDGYFGSCDLCLEVLASRPRVERLRQVLPAAPRRAATAGAAGVSP
jgi:hypothetical protein